MNPLRRENTVEILFDTANLANISEMTPIYPVSGVTTNPSIIKAEGPIPFYEQLQAIRLIIGSSRTLHVQVLAQDLDGILRDAHKLLDNIGSDIYIKIPTTEPGIQAMRKLHDEGVKVTATAIYSKTQGILAVAAGADYIAPYFNRMESLDIDTVATIKALARFIDRHGADCRVMAASFKNVAQVSAAFEAGAQAVTVPPGLLRAALSTADVTEAVRGFTRDWYETYGTNDLP